MKPRRHRPAGHPPVACRPARTTDPHGDEHPRHRHRGAARRRPAGVAGTVVADPSAGRRSAADHRRDAGAAGRAPARVRPPVPHPMARTPRVRKVTRIVRRVDAWSVFKISLIFYSLYIILLVAGMLLWNLADTTGTVANVEGFVRDLFGLKTFEFDGEKLFRAVVDARRSSSSSPARGLNVTLAVLFNLISDLVGGVRVTVLEEEVVLRARADLSGVRRRRRCRRRPTGDRAGPPGSRC